MHLLFSISGQKLLCLLHLISCPSEKETFGETKSGLLLFSKNLWRTKLDFESTNKEWDLVADFLKAIQFKSPETNVLLIHVWFYMFYRFSRWRPPQFAWRSCFTDFHFCINEGPDVWLTSWHSKWSPNASLYFYYSFALYWACVHTPSSMASSRPSQLHSRWAFHLAVCTSFCVRPLFLFGSASGTYAVSFVLQNEMFGRSKQVFA